MPGRGWWLPVIVTVVVLAAVGCSSTASRTASRTATSVEVTAVQGGVMASTGETTTTRPSYLPPLAPAGDTLTFSPADPTVGQAVQATASGCPVGDQVGMWATPAAGGVGGETMIHEVVATATGAFTFRFTWPPGLAGPAVISAGCEDLHTGKGVFDYPSQSVSVAADRTIQVTPAGPVAAGTTLAISPDGPLCPFPSTGVQLMLTADTPGAEPTYGAASGGDDVHRAWTGTLAVPASAAAGSYTIAASCVYSRSFSAAYAPVVIHVTTP